jgi:methylmalonyl-CoA/ethylmalonyl-CoA epimerase
MGVLVHFFAIRERVDHRIHCSDRGGVLTKFNKGAGGLHHIAIEVADLDVARDRLATAGLQFLEKTHVKGAGDFMCNFVSPVHTRGIQIEFVQLLAARR